MIRKAILAAVALTTCTGAALAQSAPAPTGTIPVLATTLAPAKGGGKLTVSSNAFQDSGAFPAAYAGSQNVTPPLSWSPGPAGTKSYVVLTEDSGGTRPQPTFHWVLYNVPATVTTLPQAVPTDAKLAVPAGTMNGLNSRKASGYMGPSPPPGVTHPYHFEVFALDETLDLDPASADRNAVVAAMTGHVLAEGDLVGMYTGVPKS